MKIIGRLGACVLAGAALAGLSVAAQAQQASEPRLPEAMPAQYSDPLVEGYIARGLPLPCKYWEGEWTCKSGARSGTTMYSFKVNGVQQFMVDLQGSTAGYVVHYDEKGCLVRKFPMGSRVELNRGCNGELVSGGQRYQLGPLCNMWTDPAPPTCQR